MKAKAFALALMSLSVGGAAAATFDEDSVIVLNEVFVVHQKPSAVGKLPVPLEKAPLTVSTVARPKLENLRLRDLNAAARNMTRTRPLNAQ